MMFLDRLFVELDAMVDLLGTGHLLYRRPARLYGGEKPRVAIGRALLIFHQNDPDALTFF